MKLSLALTLTCLIMLPLKTLHAEENQDQYGTTNPVEQSIEFQLDNLRTGVNTDTLKIVCWMAHELTKAGDHKRAFPVLLTCAERGHDISMLELAIMYETGVGVEKSDEKAAGWLKRSSDRGFSTAQLYYGMALLSGKGVTKDEATGKALIQQAANQKDDLAIRLINSNYNIDTVIPDGVINSLVSTTHQELY